MLILFIRPSSDTEVETRVVGPRSIGTANDPFVAPNHAYVNRRSHRLDTVPASLLQSGAILLQMQVADERSEKTKWMLNGSF